MPFGIFESCVVNRRHDVEKQLFASSLYSQLACFHGKFPSRGGNIDHVRFTLLPKFSLLDCMRVCVHTCVSVCVCVCACECVCLCVSPVGHGKFIAERYKQAITLGFSNSYLRISDIIEKHSRIYNNLNNMQFLCYILVLYFSVIIPIHKLNLDVCGDGLMRGYFQE